MLNMKKIVINTTSLLSKLTGIGQYTYNLSKELLKLGHYEYSFFYGMKFSSELRANLASAILNTGSLLREYFPYSYVLRRFIQNSSFKRGDKFDIYHEPNNILLPFNGPSVLTVHDLSWIRYPNSHPKERLRHMDVFFEAGLIKSSKIITISNFVKRELIDVFGINPSKIIVTHLGVDSFFKTRSSTETISVMNKYGLTHGSYWLSLATLEPRKNIKLILNAFLCLPDAIKKRCPLVIVGMPGWNVDNLIDDIKLTSNIITLGYLPRADVAILTSAATALLYPSIYEGFGLPPLEAISSGVPVLISNQSSLPEIIGDAGVMVNPDDVEGASLAMQKLYICEDFRNELISKGLKRSLYYSWQKCAEQTLNVYKSFN